MSRSLRFWNKGFASNAINPPDFSNHNRRPTSSDYKIFDINHMWLAEVGATPELHELYMLFDKQRGSATWVLLNNVGNATFESITITTGDLILEEGDIHINDGGLQIDLINFTSTLRTLSDGTVYGIADPGTPLSEATIYHPNNSGIVQWGKLTSSGLTVTITTTIDGVNIEAAGGTAVATLTADDANVVSPTAGGNFFLLGGLNLNTTAATPNTVIFNVDASPTFTDLTVTNDLTVNNDLTVDGDTILNNNLTVNGDIIVTGDFKSYLEINTQAGTTYTLVLDDASKEVQIHQELGLELLAEQQLILWTYIMVIYIGLQLGILV